MTGGCPAERWSALLCLGLGMVDDQLAVPHVATQRNGPFQLVPVIARARDGYGKRSMFLEAAMRERRYKTLFILWPWSLED
jgi:hypothetical protein